MAEDKIVFDVSGEDFEEKVVQASTKATVVVDFWAQWCAPCLILGPVLESVVRSYSGKVLLARLNIEQYPELASPWGIQSIPAVKIFRDGKVVKEFIGALPESEVKRQIAAAVPSPADAMALEGVKLLEQGKVSEAEKRFRRALEDDAHQPLANLALAQILVDKGYLKQAREFASKVEPEAEGHEEASSLVSRLEFMQHCQDSGGAEATARRVGEDPNNPDVCYDHACCLASKGKYKEALEALLKTVQTDKHYRDGAAKDAMVKIFSLVGERSELAGRYRSRLTQALY